MGAENLDIKGKRSPMIVINQDNCKALGTLQFVGRFSKSGSFQLCRVEIYTEHFNEYFDISLDVVRHPEELRKLIKLIEDWYAGGEELVLPSTDYMTLAKNFAEAEFEGIVK